MLDFAMMEPCLLSHPSPIIITIDLSIIYYTVHPEVSKGVARLVIGLRYLSPNGMLVTNYGKLNNLGMQCNA